MVKRTFTKFLQFILTKIMFLAAVIFFARQLRKTLKNTDLQKETKLKDKNKLVSSGSIEESTKIEVKVEKEVPKEFKIKSKSLDFETDMREIEETLQKLLDNEWDEEVMNEISAPIYMLSLSKEVEYFYSLNRKTFVPVRNNMEVVPILEEGAPGSSSLNNYFAINNEIFDIDPKKVIYIGWN